ncbi:ATP synthase F0 subunit B [Myxococcota bacterium]|nr:ATP synthase F0 subunit B [Myxococcota bacterium]
MNIYPDFTFFIQMAFFFACVWTLTHLMFPPVLAVILERQKKIDHAQRELKERDEEGRQMQRDYQEEIRKVRVQAQDIRNKARNESAQYEREILEKARQEEIKLMQEERAKISARREELQTQFEKDRSALTQEIVARLLGRSAS